LLRFDDVSPLGSRKKVLFRSDAVDGLESWATAASTHGGPAMVYCLNLARMAGLGSITWAAFLIWMELGLIVCFAYGRHRSAIRTASRGASS
jgi:C-terminus of AA_permease